jgi:AcrR family transcriptional regulator
MQGTHEKKAQIVEAAEQLFHRYGYAKTSLDDIARDAGLGKGTIYYYFNSKEDIFFEVAQHHSEEFYAKLKKILAKEKTFAAKFYTAISMPIKLAYEHAPILLDAVKNMPPNYLQKLEQFRQENKTRIIAILDEIIAFGYMEKSITESIPSKRIVQIIFDWFLLGDSNIIIKNHDTFIKKAEQDYEWIVQLLLFGLIKRGNK